MNHDKYTKNDAGYFGEQLLVATTQIQDSCFHQSLIYLCVHNQFGAMGVIINQPIPMNIRQQLYPLLAVENNIGLQAALQLGGPVEPSKGFFLHKRDYQTEHTLVTDNGLYLTPASAVISDTNASHKPEQFIFTAGYAGWSAGQLEQEIISNGWFTVPASDALVFDSPNSEKWLNACRSIGVDPFMMSNQTGLA